MHFQADSLNFPIFFLLSSGWASSIWCSFPKIKRCASFCNKEKEKQRAEKQHTSDHGSTRKGKFPSTKAALFAILCCICKCGRTWQHLPHIAKFMTNWFVLQWHSGIKEQMLLKEVDHREKCLQLGRAPNNWKDYKLFLESRCLEAWIIRNDQATGQGVSSINDNLC